MAEGVGSAPTSVSRGPCFRDRCSQLISACLPQNGCQGWTRTNTERLNRPPCYFDTTWQWLIGAAGRTCTCISSFRRRMPRLFRPRQPVKWSEQQDFHLRPPGPKPGALNTELCPDKMADQLNAERGMQNAESPPCANRAVWQSRAILHSAFYTLHLEWWEVLVMLQSSLPTFVLRHRIYRPAAGTPPPEEVDS